MRGNTLALGLGFIGFWVGSSYLAIRGFKHLSFFERIQKKKKKFLSSKKPKNVRD